MPAEQRRRIRAALSLAVLACGMLLALPFDHSVPPQAPVRTSATLFDEPQFSIQLGRNRLQITGTTTSHEHEAALLQLASEQFAVATIDTDFRMAVTLAPDWETLNTRLLYLVAATEAAQAVLQARHIEIRGVSDDGPGYQSRRKFLHDAIDGNGSLTSDVIIVDNGTSFADLCRRNFASFATEPIRFRPSGTHIRSSSYPLLDKLAEFAYDCNDGKIAIIGHSDATGAAAWNVRISLARAQVVAAELAQRGLTRDRLILEGRGASQPIAANETADGREKNRRVEFELR
ncbi:MAG: OmpA family protein [Proteobacteria bacterium]|nr:OmpA family protein [Pseudomonadota bacterium]